MFGAEGYLVARTSYRQLRLSRVVPHVQDWELDRTYLIRGLVQQHPNNLRLDAKNLLADR
jgi:hypothetical protein